MVPFTRHQPRRIEALTRQECNSSLHSTRQKVSVLLLGNLNLPSHRSPPLSEACRSVAGPVLRDGGACRNDGSLVCSYVRLPETWTILNEPEVSPFTAVSTAR